MLAVRLGGSAWAGGRAREVAGCLCSCGAQERRGPRRVRRSLAQDAEKLSREKRESMRREGRRRCRERGTSSPVVLVVEHLVAVVQKQRRLRRVLRENEEQAIRNGKGTGAKIGKTTATQGPIQ